ncbi:hypothetical protein [Thioalkalivibrio sp. XN279]|uniref:hypothetical protein n=1 Tax=Thioalkalivibrio sp. XN279 TaxID=2714953 RepID=UPI00140E653A|nr:hypothetical protein [Thioalkalivibrio sp. XN279]NHA15271.1 hypothetical protein [Thioalkalivibrio sp. XN279]
MDLLPSSRRNDIVPTRSTLFLPGLETVAQQDAPRLPALERLLARARSRPGGCCWALLAAQAGGDLGRWPVGPVSALADLGAAASACLRVEPLGMDAEQRGAFRLRAPALALTSAEAQALAAGFNAAFAADGVRLQVATPVRWYLWQESAGVPWRGFATPSLLLDPAHRPAPPEPALRKLLSEAEMLFFAHPVNAARREQGLPLVAGLHPWGGGRLELPARAAVEVPAVPGAGEPYLAGLRRLGVVPLQSGARDEAPTWALAPEAFQVEALARIDREVIAPLLARLRRSPGMRLRLATGRATHELGAAGLLQFWRRPRHWALAC